jgi:hypothetical protein
MANTRALSIDLTGTNAKSRGFASKLRPLNFIVFTFGL